MEKESWCEGENRLSLLFTRTLEKGPWLPKGDALIIAPYDVKMRPSEIKLESIPLWVQIYDLPPIMMTEKMGRALGERLGLKVLEVDVEANGRNNGEFFRIRVEWPVQKPLLTKLAIKPKDRAQVTRYDLKYERVPHFCFYCGRIGHAESFCSKDQRDECGIRFGAYLRAPPFKKFEHRRWTVQATTPQPMWKSLDSGSAPFSRSVSREPTKEQSYTREERQSQSISVSKIQRQEEENRSDVAILDRR